VATPSEPARLVGRSSNTWESPGRRQPGWRGCRRSGADRGLNAPADADAQPVGYPDVPLQGTPHRRAVITPENRRGGPQIGPGRAPDNPARPRWCRLSRDGLTTWTPESTDDRSSWRRAGAQSSTAVLLALEVGVQGRIERSDRLSELSGRATEPFGIEPATELDQPPEKITHVPQVSQHRV